MTEPVKIIAEGNHTIFVLGNGEQGKTVFTKRILVNLKALGISYFVMDPTGQQYSIGCGKVYSAFAELKGEIPDQVIFRWRTVEDFDLMSKWLYHYSTVKPQGKRIYVVIEEAQISLASKKNHPLIDLVLTGRGNNVYFIIVNRALMHLSSSLFDSASMFVLFKNQNEVTLARLKTRYGIDPNEIMNLPQFEKRVHRV